ncbi:MAG TPA: CRTAC1 family protein [Terriglobia bacterium]|nr:CRTAC1 family protein [Terriglobia bacterium]
MAFHKHRPTRREMLALVGGSLLLPYPRGLFSPQPQSKVAELNNKSPIRFSLAKIPFQLETDETPTRHAPATMAGGVAVFDYNNDGRPDIFFTNGANIQTLKKDAPKYSNRLFRNDGHGVFTDVTARAGLAGSGYDMGAAVGDYDNDGNPDLFVAGVHHNTLYHNNGDGTFTDVTAKAGLGQWNDPEFGPLWSITGAWVDVNSDGLLDLFVVNYLQWDYAKEPLCGVGKTFDYCNPSFYKGLPCQLFLNKGDGMFEDVSAAWGLRSHVGKGMGASMADYDLDGRPDIFVTNDTYYNFLFHNIGKSFEEVGLQEGVALVTDGEFISGMGLDFRDINNDGYPDIAFVALNNQTFPIFRNDRGSGFEEITDQSGMRELSFHMSGYGAGLFDFDNDGWKDLFVTRGHVESLPKPDAEIDQYNTVFRNTGASGKWQALTGEAGFNASPPARHRGCAFGDLDGDGRVDVVATAIGRPAEIWMNRSPGGGNWLDVALVGTKSNRDGIGAVVKIVTKAGAQYNHMTTSCGYASSSHGPVHFGLGDEAVAEQMEIRWPSGAAQTLRNVRGGRTITVKERQG